MSSMDYCRFENTYDDLLACKEDLETSGGIQEHVEKVNEYEKSYVPMLIELCVEIAEQFGDELEL